jgi:hypothetical protein
VNGTFSTGTNQVYVRGALWLGGNMPSTNTSSVYAAMELHAASGLAMGSWRADGDAFLGGDVTASSALFPRTLHVPASAMLGPGVHYGALAREPVNVPPPCDCSTAQTIPVAAIVAYHHDHNDNAAIGLDPAALSAVNMVGGAFLDLPCGRYYLSSIAGSRGKRIRTHGRTALFIDDIDLTGPMTIAPDGDGELDVFIGGTITNSGGGFFVGNIEHPSHTRIYIAGTGVGSGLLTFGGNVYMPNADLSAGIAEVFGGVFARTHSSGEAYVHYDRDVLRAGAACGGPPPTGCTSCRDCGNQACIDGQCGACRSNADCCAPLVCSAGVCIATPE